jgi:alanine racemase
MLSLGQLTNQSSRRDAWLEIELDRLEENIRTVRNWLVPKVSGQLSISAKKASGKASSSADELIDAQKATLRSAKLMGVVKSDAYGHGACEVAQVLKEGGASWLGVASVDEGVTLREARLDMPILVLSPAPCAALAAVLEYHLDITVSSLDQLKELEPEIQKFNQVVRIHLKTDTGMHRLGISYDQLPSCLDRISGNPLIRLISVYSHLSKADDFDETQKQNALFEKFIARVKEEHLPPAFFHLASGEAARRFPFSHHDLIRAGLCLYGLESKTHSQELKPLLSVRGRINQLKEIDAGEALGYGLTWRSERPTQVACLPIGYADGVDRGLSNRMRGLLGGQFVEQVGIISMDQMLFDVTDIPKAKMGDVITLIGDEKDAQGKVHTIALADWALLLDTITYELACRMRIRLPRIYKQSPVLDANRIGVHERPSGSS